MDQDEKWLLREKYNGEKSEAFFADCKRLALGEPLGYLIGHVPFLDCTIWLDKHPLIPRPETEYWVEKAIEVIQANSKQSDLFSEHLLPNTTQHVLDLCAGSGCIGVGVAQAVPEARVDFSEIDTRLLSTIEKNIRTNDIDPFKTTIYHSNLFTKIPQEKTYDFILSNPPYIDPALDRAEPAVKAHEPHLALYGGKAGTEIIEAIITQAPQYLRTGGQLWLEHEAEQSAFIQHQATECGFTANTHTDQYKVDRYSVLVLQP